METTDPIPRPQCLASQEDGGVGTKMDLDPVRDQTETTHGSPLVSSGERPQDDTKVLLPAPAVIPRYYGVMDDEGVDDLFIPPAPPPSAPSYVAALLPADSTGATESNSNLTLAKEAADATEAKANPDGLDWHHDEKQLMAAQQNEVDKVIAGTSQTSKEFMDTVSLSNDSTPPTDQHQTSMEGAGSLMAPSGRNHRHNAKGEDESKGEAEDIVNLCEGEDNWRESDVARDKYPKQIPSNIEENSERKLTKENFDCDSVETNAPTPELCKYNQNKTGAATNQTQVAEIPTEVTNDDDDDDEHFDTRSLNFNLTKCDWLSISEVMSKEYVTETVSPEMVRREHRGDGSLRIATEIQQGEQLLQRLQLLQLRQDLDMSESPSTSQQVVQERRVEESGVLGTEVDDLRESRGDLTGEDEKDEAAKTNLMKKETIERNESKETQIPIVSAHQQFSDTETMFKQQIQEAAQGKQNLQRAGGVFNLVDDPDVLEIPFTTNIPLESLSTTVGPGLRSDSQFSERKMQKEISQEIQKEMVLVIQGKIPGEYSKGEVRQLHKTKLLFEAFQQDNAEGPTRHKKPPTSVRKGHISPTVLERTRSLEMLSLQSFPISRAHSFRLYKSTTSEREKSPENTISKSPTEGSRDKTRLSPYPKQDLRLYRSMDSINTDVPMSAVETRHLTVEGNTTHESPILRQNPFFKLRPALALQPEVEKDIREARKREEELRKQRCSLYGENRQDTEDEEKSATLIPGSKQQSRGKLERVWPPPSKKDQIKSEQTQQEPKVHRAGDQKAPLWQRWESGQINGKASEEKN